MTFFDQKFSSLGIGIYEIKKFPSWKKSAFFYYLLKFYSFFDFNAPCLCKTEMNFQFWCGKNH